MSTAIHEHHSQKTVVACLPQPGSPTSPTGPRIHLDAHYNLPHLEDPNQAFRAVDVKPLPDPSYVAELVEELEDCLSDLLLPRPIDRSAKPLNVGTQITVCHLALPSEHISPLMCSGRHAPGTLYLAISHTWVSRRGSELWLHKGYSADATGQVYLDAFDPPRLITYFANFFTAPASYGRRTEGNTLFQPLREALPPMPPRHGAAVGSLLRTPSSSSPMLELLTNDKLYTRTVLARALVPFPTTLAFSYRNPRQYTIRRADLARITIVPTFEERTGHVEVITSETTRFLQQLTRDGVARVVVKPSGPLWMESHGVKFFSPTDTEKVINYIRQLLEGHGLPNQAEVVSETDRRAEERAARAAAATASDDPEAYVDFQLEYTSDVCSVGDGILVEEFLPTMAPQELAADDVVLSIPTAPGAFALAPAVPQPLSATPSIHHDPRTVEIIDEEEDALSPVVFEVAPPSRKLGFRIRVIVVMNAAGMPVTAEIISGIGPSDQPLNGVNTVPATIEQTLEQWGIASAEQRDAIIEQLRSDGARVLQAIAAAESQMSAEARGGDAAFTDVVGVDFLLVRKRGRIIPHVIEVNDHDCYFSAQQLETILPSRRDKAMLPWLERMVARSHQYILRDTVAVVIGGGGHSKRFVWEETKSWGMRIVLVDNHADHFAKDLVWKFIHYPDLADHANDEGHVLDIVRLVREALGTADGIADAALARDVHGVVTFWEDATVVTAMVARHFGCIGSDPDAQHRVKNKFRCFSELAVPMEKLAGRPFRSAYLTPPSTFIAKVARVRGPEDFAEAVAKVPLPAVLKLEHGSSAVGVALVRTEDELRDKWEGIQEKLHSEAAHEGCGLGFNNDMILMEYLTGTEHDVDVVIYDGELVCAFVTDNGPTRLPVFCETGAVMPSLMHPDKTSALIFAAHHICRAAGLRNGVFNVEMKYTPTGPKLIEINGRMGGFYIRDWVKRLYGVDLLRCAFLVAFGIRPSVPARAPMTDRSIVGLMLYGSQHGPSLRPLVESGRLQKLADTGVLLLNIFEDTVPEPGEYEEPYCNVAIMASNAREATNRLLAILHTLLLETDTDPKSETYFSAMGCL